MSAKVFITGTDTGVGKTWLTARLLEALRAGGVRALAMKPFCCGGTADLEAYEAVQGSELPRAQLNPYYFPEPVAPLVAARKHNRRIPLDEAVRRIDEAAARCDLLLVEGAGGLFVPLGPRYSVAHLIGRLKCPVVVVGPNRLGVINHVMLTLHALEALGIKEKCVALMGQKRGDLASADNAAVLRELADPVAMIEVPFVTERSGKFARKHPVALREALERLVEFVGPAPRWATKQKIVKGGGKAGIIPDAS